MTDDRTLLACALLIVTGAGLLAFARLLWTAAQMCDEAMVR